jgi:diacylglycerol kinase (ATP)
MIQGLVQIIVNPISGPGHDPRFLRELERHLTLRGFPVAILATERAGHARDLARNTPDDARCVVSIGGDGTHREVLAGLVNRPLPACIVPSGTENVLARTYRLTGTIHEIVDTIQNGLPVGLDVGLANDHPFLMFSGVGFDAAVVEEVHRKRTGRIYRSTYFGPIVRMWWRYGFPPMSVTVDGRLVTDDAGVLLVANTPLYGDGLRMAPLAVGDDGLLDVVCYRTRERWQMLRHFLRTRLGTHLGHPLVAYARGRHVEVACRERVLPVQADGDSVAQTPVTFALLPKAVRLLLPRGHLNRHRTLDARRAHGPANG